MIVKDDQRKTCFRMCVESVGHEYFRAKEHGLAPERGQQFALDANVPDVLRIGRRLDWRDYLIEHKIDMPALQRHAVFADRDFARSAVNVARLLIPMLSFTAIGWQRQRVPVGTMKYLVSIEQRLHGI